MIHILQAVQSHHLTFFLSLFGLVSLVVYRRVKKMKHGDVTTMWDFLDRNIVEIIHGAAIAPSVANTIFKFI